MPVVRVRDGGSLYPWVVSILNLSVQNAISMRTYRDDRRVENHRESDRHHVQIVQECLRKGEIDARKAQGKVFLAQDGT